MLLSELRNPSQIHLEFLSNMDVKASLSFSILVKGKLWGLISCHHQSPKYATVWQRQLGDLVAKSFANIVLTTQEQRNYEEFAHYKHKAERLLQQVKQSDIQQGLFEQPLNVLSITQSRGAAVLLENQLVTLGTTPGENQIQNLIDWLIKSNTSPLFYTRELTKHLPAANQYAEQGSGLLALEISRYGREYLLFFKPQIQERRIWAGNPEKPELGADLRIHPRKSFAKWEEEIKGKSLPWTINELEITQLLLKDVIALRLQRQATHLEQLNQTLKATAEQLQGKNKQLEDFAYIITHNLRSPMLTIGSLYEYYQKNPTSEKASTVMAHIKTVSENMLTTVRDLNQILKTRIDHLFPEEPVSLENILVKETQNLAALMQATQAEIQIDLAVSSLSLPKIYLESILHNLLSNALKYHSPQRRPAIHVKSWQQEEQAYLSVSDNGLGMDLTKVGDKLFGLYKTFHEHKEAKGLGLYLTKLQVEALGGTIRVESQPDHGTTFTLSFPFSKPLAVGAGA
jgi:light-regulated signal transduction histidine kinase (bacteriophytochrome)